MANEKLSEKGWNKIFMVVTGFNVLCSLILLMFTFTMGMPNKLPGAITGIAISPSLLFVAVLITLAARMLYKSIYPASAKQGAPPAYRFALYSLIVYVVLEVFVWIVFAAIFL